jgi:hypothetical protein
MSVCVGVWKLCSAVRMIIVVEDRHSVDDHELVTHVAGCEHWQ